MRFWSSFFLLLPSCLVSAFPTLSAHDLESLTATQLRDALDAVKKHQEKRLIINPNKPIQVTGKHVFKAPTKYDKRGPCPGLNALANHGYISHSGITSLVEVVAAINEGNVLARMVHGRFANNTK